MTHTHTPPKAVRTLRAAFIAIATTLTLTACHTADDNRIPPAPVRIEFPTVGTWQTYGVTAALSTRQFIKSQRKPADFPYTDASATGFAGVILAGAFTGEPLAYDLACPVEMKQNIRIAIDTNTNTAICHTCGSTYDIFRTGTPLSGPAADKGYALTRYRVTYGNTPLDYIHISR